MTSHAEFARSRVSEFPEVQNALDDELPLLHLQMHEFCRFVQAAIDAGDRTVAERCFQFADRVFRDADDDVKNAVYVSFLEHLNFIDGKAKRAWALQILPPALCEGRDAILEYMSQIGSEK